MCNFYVIFATLRKAGEVGDAAKATDRTKLTNLLIDQNYINIRHSHVCWYVFIILQIPLISIIENTNKLYFVVFRIFPHYFSSLYDVIIITIIIII